MTVRVLVVCTANICRSPTAAALLRSRTGPAVEVMSAGTHARRDDPVCPVAAAWIGGLRPGDADVRRSLADHRSAPLSADLIASADLVLTMSRAQRSGVIALVPSAQRRTFPIRYVERLAPELMAAPDRPIDQVGRVLWLSDELHARRAEHGVVSDEEDTVPDPHETGDHPSALAILGRAVSTVVLLVTGDRPAR
jgi:protein-tyrosine phosphatase